MITSLLDNDFYAFTMAQAIHQAGDSDLEVRYEFRNRTFSVPLARRIDMNRLSDIIENVRNLRFSSDEIAYLGKLGLFTTDFLGTLKTVRLPEVHTERVNGHLVMTYEGRWVDAIYWETILLAIVNELYFSRFGSFFEEGEQRLHEKIGYLEDRKTLKFAEFGTRRRFSTSWQHFVTHTIKDRIPDLLLGTSNVELARDLDLVPVGTMAHQLFMVYTALSMNKVKLGDYTEDPIAVGLNAVMDMWLDSYQEHPNMLTILPDTYTTDAFLQRAELNLLSQFQAYRQDSGDPVAIGDKLVRAAHKLGHGKPKIMFSDSLDVRSASVIEDHFRDQIDMVPAIGTNLTNDLGYEPLSIVIKPCAVRTLSGEWEPCVKLSDDPQKVTGANTEPYLRAIGV